MQEHPEMWNWYVAVFTIDAHSGASSYRLVASFVHEDTARAFIKDMEERASSGVYILLKPVK